MNEIILIGDVHGSFKHLDNILIDIKKNNNQLIILGDVGIGFPYSTQQYDFNYNIVKQKIKLTNFHEDPEYLMWIRGNHDHPGLCTKNKNYLGDYGVYKNMFFVSGAWSIDKDARTPGVDWWFNEELNIVKFEELFTLYEKIKPDIVISHDCPQQVNMCIHPGSAYPTRTGQAMDSMINIHKPKHWIFGHHHMSFEITINDIHFKCLNCFEMVNTNEFIQQN